MKFLLGMLLVSLLLQAEEAKKEGKSEIPNFAMLDYKGRFHELRRTDAKAVVLFFTQNGCPVARQSISRLKKLQKAYSPKGVQVWMVDSNAADDRESIQKEAQEFNAGRLPILQDETQGIAALLNVKRTGTVICIETKT